MLSLESFTSWDNEVRFRIILQPMQTLLVVGLDRESNSYLSCI